MFGYGKRRVAVCLALFALLILSLAARAQDTIYVGEASPSAVHAFTFNGTSFNEQTLDPLNDGKFLRGGLGSLCVTATDHFFVFGDSFPGILGSFVDPVTKTEFAPFEGADGLTNSLVIPTNDQHYVFGVGQNAKVPYLTVMDVWPPSPTFLTTVASLPLLPVPPAATSDPGLQSAHLAKSIVATLSPDGSTLYVGLANSSDLNPDAAVVAVSVTSPTSPAIVSAVRIPAPTSPYPGLVPGRAVAGIRYGTVGGFPYLFLLRRDLYLVPVSGALSSSTPFEMSVPDDPITTHGRQLQDITIQDGGSPRAFVLSQSCTNGSCSSVQKEILTVDLSGALAGNPTGNCPAHPCLTNFYAYHDGGDFGPDFIQQSLGGNYLYAVDGAGSPFTYPSQLLAFDPAAVASGSGTQLLAHTNVDSLGGSDPSTAVDFISSATNLFVRNAVTPTSPSIVISDANAETGKLFTNDTSHTLTVTGSGLGGVVWAFLGATKLTGLSATNTLLTATIPKGVPAGAPLLFLFDSSGGLSSFSGFTVDNPAQYLAGSAVYVFGAACDTYSVINSTSGSEVETTYPSNVQSPHGIVTKDGKYLFIAGAEGRVAVHSLIADPAHGYGWNTPVETLYAAADTGVFLGGPGVVQNPDPSRSTVYLDALFYIAQMDPTTYPPCLIDSDGDSGTTDPNMPSGISLIPLPGITISISPSRDGKWLYAGGFAFSGASEIVAIDVSSDVNASRSINEYPVPGFNGNAHLAVSADNNSTTIFFAINNDTVVHAYPRNVSDGSVDIAGGVTMAPPPSDPWALGDPRIILAPPDGRFIYVNSKTAKRIDVFDATTFAWIAKIPAPIDQIRVGLDSQGMDVSTANPTNDYLFIGDGEDNAVLIVDERPGSPTIHHILTTTFAACEPDALSVSPGAATKAGPNVNVTPTQNSTVTYSNVTTAGNTTVTSTNVTSLTTPPNFELAICSIPNSSCSNPVYYDVSTTATISGPVTVCFQYDDSGMTTQQEDSLVLMHQSGGTFVDVTTSLDTTTNTICGQVSSFSQFVLAQTTTAVNFSAPGGFSTKGGGPLNVTIFGSASFDVTQIDPASLRLLSQGIVSTVTPGGKAATPTDANKDGYLDLKVAFPRSSLKVSGSKKTSGTIYLQGRRLDGTAFAGQAQLALN